MNGTQAIRQPCGVTVFGSALVRVEPDVAQIDFKVTTIDKKPTIAFQKTREGADAVRSVLAEAGVDTADVRTSHIRLETARSGYGDKAKVIGQRATIAFSVILGEIESLEDILVQVIENGANEIDKVSFHSRQLGAVRAQARRHAVAAARRKAELYADAADISLGSVIHMEDQNPRYLATGGGHGEDLDFTNVTDDEKGPRGPGAITVAAAVLVTFAIV